MRESYAKETKKSKPVAIRYNLEEFQIAKTNSGKQTVQSLFDFLLNKYVNGILIPNPGQTIGSLPLSPIVQEQAIIPPYDAYKLELSAAGSIDAIKKIVKAAEKDSELTGWQKNQIETIGIQLSQKLEY